ncbi:MAG: hypothetical protein GWP03_01995 [Proteobacteria bacterium]|nr:hypothetical protein [Pseudomonadota bacterium]
MKKTLLIGLSLFLLLSFAFTSVYADITGKIAGRVVDAKTGEPLPGVNVIIVGTQMGAATDMNGYYFIVNIPVETYTVEASMISYAPTKVENVQVNADLTTTVNFKLSQKALKLKTLVVKAKRKMIIADATQTTRVVGAQSMAKLPVATFQGVINRQAGVVSGHVRGGRGDEVAYMVDGMSVQNPITGGQGATVGNTAVEQISMLTGGFNAEYGQAMSGVMNIITKEGGRRFSGNLQVLSNGFLPNSISNKDNNIEIGFGGPLGTNMIRYYLSGDIRNVKDYNPHFHIVPSYPVMNDSLAARYERNYLFRYDSTSGKTDSVKIGDYTIPYRGKRYDADYWQDYSYMLPHHGRGTYHGQAKLTFKLSKIKINLSSFIMRDQYEPLQTGSYANQFKYHLDNYLSVLNKAYKHQVTINGMINNGTYFTIRLGNFTHSHIAGLKDMAFETNRYWWQDYKYIQDPLITIYDSVIVQDGDTIYDFSRDSISLQKFIWSHIYYREPNAQERFSPWGFKPIGTMGNIMIGDYRDGYLSYYKSSSYIAKGNITSQITKNHLVKAGVEYNKYDIFSSVVDGPNLTNPFADNYDVKPYSVAGYVQDKMEFEGMVVNIGTRADLFNPKVKYAPDISHQDSVANASIKYQISPRLGISFPVTDKQVFHLTYGHFFQNPAFGDIYTTLFPDLSRSNQVIGNPAMPAEHTISYEFGLANQIGNDMSFDLTWYYKDIFGLIGFEKVSLPSFTSYRYVTSDYGNSKGLEFTFTKRGEVVSGQLSYTLSFSQGTSADPWDEYENSYGDPNFDLSAFKRKIYPLSFDRRHVVNGNITLAVPGDPNTYMSLMANYETGEPYTPRDSRGNKLGEYYSARMPAIWSTDVKLNKQFTIGKIKPNFFVQVTNLFNTKNVLDVYETTGKPDDDGVVITEINSDSIYYKYGDANYSLLADRNGDGYINGHEIYLANLEGHHDLVNRPDYLGTQRRILIGIQLAW